jgi:hypothetical protein
MRAKMTAAGSALLAAHRGATTRTVDWIAVQLAAAGDQQTTATCGLLPPGRRQSARPPRP